MQNRQKKISWGETKIQLFDDQPSAHLSQSPLEKKTYNPNQMMPCNRTPNRKSNNKNENEKPQNDNQQVIKCQFTKKISFLPILRNQVLEEIKETDEPSSSYKQLRYIPHINNSNQVLKDKDFCVISASKSTVPQIIYSTPLALRTSGQKPLNQQMALQNNSVRQQPSQPIVINPDELLKQLLNTINQYPDVEAKVQYSQMDEIIHNLTTLISNQQSKFQQLQNDLEELPQYVPSDSPVQPSDDIHSSKLREKVINILGFTITQINQINSNSYQLRFVYKHLKVQILITVQVFQKKARNIQNFTFTQKFQYFLAELDQNTGQIQEIVVLTLQLQDLVNTTALAPIDIIQKLYTQTYHHKSCTHMSLTQMANSLPVQYKKITMLCESLERCKKMFGCCVLQEGSLLRIAYGYRIFLNEIIASFEKGDHSMLKFLNQHLTIIFTYDLREFQFVAVEIHSDRRSLVKFFCNNLQSYNSLLQLNNYEEFQIDRQDELYITESIMSQINQQENKLDIENILMRIQGQNLY